MTDHARKPAPDQDQADEIKIEDLPEGVEADEAVELKGGFLSKEELAATARYANSKDPRLFSSG